jgi:zinc transporter 7
MPSLLSLLTYAGRSLGIFVGFAAFFMMEKTLRVLGGGEEGGHSHSHSHAPESASGHATGVSGNADAGLRQRSGALSDEKVDAPATVEEPTTKGPSKLSAYLNLFGDFVHNMSVRLLAPARARR